MSKPKDQGTRFETWMVTWLVRTAEAMNARRLAEGGSNDEGDLEWFDQYDERWVGECKATQTLNVTRVLDKARKKSPVPVTTVLFWKRLTKSKGNTNRTPDGVPVVVVMGLDTFAILNGHPDE